MTRDDDCPSSWPPLRLRDRVFAGTDFAVMAILNRTPDSFFDRGAHFDLDRALERAEVCVQEGADIIDVGGVPAGWGPHVDAAEETRRVLPVIEAIRSRFPEILVSVDTWRSEVGRQACRAGVDLVNDNWQGVDPQLARVAAEFGAGLVCSHTGSHRPRQDPHRVHYPDVLQDVVDTVTKLARRAEAVGVRPEQILVDAALDFGKNSYHSLAALAGTRTLAGLGWPVLLAISNKDVVAESIGWDGPPEGRLSATLAATAVAAWEGGRVFRAHDVAATRQALDMVSAMRSGRPRLARRGLA